MAESKEALKFDRKMEQQEKPKGRPEVKIDDTRLIRILGKDIYGSKKVYLGLTSIKGISWAFSNALCIKLGINKNKQIQELTEDEIKKITEFVKNPKLPTFLMNRRKDYDTGADKHLYGSDLDLQKEFDIKKLKKIKAYKGIRHSLGQPVRGQRTKSHFRSNKKKSGGSTGVRKVATKEAAKTPAKK